MSSIVGGSTGFTFPDGTTQSTAASGGAAWQSVQTSSFTAVAGNAYAVNTTSAAITVTLPASPAAGQYLIVTDYARQFSVNNCTLNPNGLKIQASTSNVVLSTNGQSVNIVYIDSTQGWIVYASGNAVGPYLVSYFIASGGGSSSSYGGGGGAGGYLTGTGISVSSGTAYTITIGAGGAGQIGSTTIGIQGSQSTAFGYSPVGGGYGGTNNPSNGGSGGSGGGAGSGGTSGSGGSGTSGQGNAGGGQVITSPYPSGGGGGAGAIGGTGSGSVSGGGGVGITSTISGASVYYCGGGSGGYRDNLSGTGTAPGSGGGGAGGNSTVNGSNGTANTGGGGGGAGAANTGGSGGSGIVIIAYAGSQRGTGGTVTSSGGNTIHTFTSSGTYTA